jgi:hypothetical protein
MNFRATRFNVSSELGQMFIEMINRLELGACREIPSTLPILKPQLSLIADDLVFAHRRLNDAAMSRVRRNPPGVFVEMSGWRAHHWASTSAK